MSEITVDLEDQETVTVIDDVIGKLCRYFTFGIYGPDDIKQECWVYILELVRDELYVPDRASLRTFLYVFLRNRLKDLRRAQYERITVCTKCKQKPNRDCKKCQKAYYRNLSKKYLAQPISFCGLIHGKMVTGPDTVFDEVSFDELVEYLDKSIPIFLRADYLRMLDGVSIGQSRKKLLRQVITEAMKKFNGEEEN